MEIQATVRKQRGPTQTAASASQIMTANLGILTTAKRTKKLAIGPEQSTWTVAHSSLLGCLPPLRSSKSDGRVPQGQTVVFCPGTLAVYLGVKDTANKGKSAGLLFLLRRNAFQNLTNKNCIHCPSSSHHQARNSETFTTKLETPSCNLTSTKLFQSAANKLYEDLAKAQHSQPKRSFALGLLFHSVLSQRTVADFTQTSCRLSLLLSAGGFLCGLTVHKQKAALAS